MENRVLVTTVPFASYKNTPIRLLENNNIPFILNPFDRKLTEADLKSLIPEFNILIAGTEPITASVIDAGKQLKLISRVGVGLDSVDLLHCSRKDIKVSYTPEAPVPAVAELTMGLILNLLRSVHLANNGMHEGKWKRFFGTRLAESIVGIVGAGRIGSAVINHLIPFNPKKILVNDVTDISINMRQSEKIHQTSLKYLLSESDIVSLHVPLTESTRSLIGKEQLHLMKKGAYIINTARGGIINENDLYNALSQNHISGAAVDVFEDEPYSGPLKNLHNCLLTAHMGSMSVDCRAEMEIRATENVVSFVKTNELINGVPDYEYEIQKTC